MSEVEFVGAGGMNDAYSGSAQRSAVATLRSMLVSVEARRAQIESTLERERTEAEEAHESARRTAETAGTTAIEEAEAAWSQRTAEIDERLSGALASIAARLDAERAKVAGRAEALRSRANERLRESGWMADTLREAARDRARKRMETDRTRLRDLTAEMRSAVNAANAVLKRLGRKPIEATPDVPENVPGGASGLAASETILTESVARSRQIAAALDGQVIARVFLGLGPIALGAGALLLGGLGGAGWSMVTEGPMLTGVGLGVAGAVVLVGAILAAGRWATGRFVSRHEAELRASLARGLGAASVAEDRAEEAAEELVQADLDRAKAEQAAAERRQRAKLEEAESLEGEQLPSLEADAAAREQAARTSAAESRAAADATRAEVVDRATGERATSLDAAGATLNDTVERLEAQAATDRGTLDREWSTEAARIAETLGACEGWLDRFCLAFGNAGWDEGLPGGSSSGMATFGRVRVNPADLDGELPAEGTPDQLRSSLVVPGAVDLSNAAALVVTGSGDARERAVETLRTTAFRALTSIPAGKVRLTIIDPVSLGQNFAAFMHLGDHDPQLVSDRIWTEPRHIEQKLADLTEHMETVIQKYLRNEFASIADYNERAGEIAEPYRFLIINDFPAGFTEISAKRLASIVATGARCGVHTLIHIDDRRDMPTGFSLDDLAREAERVTIRPDGTGEWDDDAYRGLPLELETMPEEANVTRVLGRVGEAALRAGRVEVPFEMISPQPGEEWSRSCDDELRVPLGRSGATKFQELALGRGTAQHALVSGKTGSGKSTLLHVLITNLALWYSPDEVEFYLIDFKKGVEFKAYTNGKVPHARAVAIESDREFGLSVIAEVDQELKRRGELFRDLSVQNLAGYRRAVRERGDDAFPKLPRTLVIIDEFQEIFTEDDKISAEASLLLDRLVRQGRAFGIHVLMGSQTLAGAYSVARSTLGQMAVRVALQCSEADSYVILHEDNAAARLLSRPGEAIYNDGGGLVEHNSPFQVCWLSDDERDGAHDRVLAKANTDSVEGRGLVVFEGNAPARLENNAPLRAARRERDAQTQPPRSARAFLGEPVAIKDPTSASFRRQHGSNLLIVGQREEPLLALAASSILSLADQIAPEHARFVVVDSTPADDPAAGTLAAIVDSLPHDARVVGPRDAEQAVLDLGAELARRESAEMTAGEPSVFLVLVGAHRVRAIRRSEDDYSFSMDDEPAAPKPDKVLASLVREGPPLGLHAIITCDTAPNAERLFDRQTMREFDSRVLFQMNATDSSTMIDSPEASRLGLHRAILASEESGTVEKFRPYELPSARRSDAPTH